MTSPLDLALAWASLGVRVFPLYNSGAAAVDNPYETSTIDETQLRKWFGGSWGDDFGVALAMGHLDDGTPVLGLDEDVKDGRDGPGEVARLGEDNDFVFVPEDTAGQGTPSGGRHRIMRCPHPVGNSVGRVAPGVDVRGVRGYLRAYHLPDGPILDAPTWLVNMAVATRERAENADQLHPDIPEWDPKEGLARGQAILDAYDGAPEGERNHRTYTLAAELRGWAWSHDTCLIAVQDWNYERNEPPLPSEEVERTVQSAYEGNVQDPAGIKLATRHDSFEKMQQDISNNPHDTAETINRDTKPDKVSRKWFYSRPEMELIEPPVWAIDDTIPESAIVLIFGPWGAYKTCLALDLSLHMACGKAWHSHATQKVLNIIYVTQEGRRGIPRRVRAWETEHNDGKLIPNITLGSPMPAFASTEELASWAKALATERPAVVVLDTVSHAISGWDENSTRDVSEFMAAIYSLRDLHDCIVILIHHSGKDEAKGHRGSEEFAQKADVVLKVSSPERGSVVVKMTKQREDDPWPEAEGFHAKKVGGAVVLVPDPSALKKDPDYTNLSRTVRAVKALRSQSGKVVGCAWLAGEIVKLGMDDDDPNPVSKSEVTKVTRWLTQTAHKGPLKDYVAHLTDAGNGSEWVYSPSSEKPVDELPESG